MSNSSSESKGFCFLYIHVLGWKWKYKTKTKSKQEAAFNHSKVGPHLQFCKAIFSTSFQFHITAYGDLWEVATLMKNKKMGRQVAWRFISCLFIYLRLPVRCWQNNPASVSFSNSAIIQERQFIIRLPLSRHQPSQLGPLRLPVTQSVSDSSTSLLSRLESWKHQPKHQYTTSTLSDWWGQRGDSNDTPEWK